MDTQYILNRFGIDNITECIPFGDGHINNTFRVTTPAAQYILQKLNTNVFKKPQQVMENIERVTVFLRNKIRHTGGDPSRETLCFLKATDGKNYFEDESGFWRVSRYVTGTKSSYCAESAHDFYLGAVAFGRFQRFLSDFPADTLYETIPDFHNTPKRYRDLEEAVKSDVCSRAASVQKELEFVRSRMALVNSVQGMYEKGEIPLRVTHNDTKLNNVLLDEKTGRGICVVDLDTVMPGFSVYDFGDAIRSGACTCAEDDPDFEKACLDLELFDAFVKGFLEGCGEGLTENEIKAFPVGAMAITLECGMRFLTDYLSGDTYFRIERPDHNLDRCRTQFHMVLDMEKKQSLMESSVAKYISL
ncbi:MAG: aminoglycoside phosphotransferase family protein [Clostridia bacterium]|nr:aminoglycoside phosphotransferase family protein [Clostridia bacterium]